MDDQLIIKKFRERSEDAIQALSDKYGKLCHALANRILHNEQDAEECVNDTWLVAWNIIPPASPDPLSTYLCGITRNLSVAKYHANTAKKRNHYYDLVLDELADSLPGNTLVEDEIPAKELGHAINGFLYELRYGTSISMARNFPLSMLQFIRKFLDLIPREE